MYNRSLVDAVMDTNHWLTVQDAARLSNYRADHLRELIRKGRIKARKFGPLWAVDQDSLLAYMDEAQQSQDKRHGPRPKKRKA